jgi:HSP20 family protein
MLARNFFRDPFAAPFRSGEMYRDLQRFQDSLNRFMTQEGRSAPSEYPLINLWQDGEDAVLTAELPGVAADDLDISVVQNTLTLRGQRQRPELKPGETYHRQERWQGRFVRSLELPFAVDANKIEARFENGVLSVKLPRAEEHKPKKIAVHSS